MENQEKNNRNVGNAMKVRILWAKSGLTYEQLARLTGIKINTLANWITERKNPPDYVVEFIRMKINDYKKTAERFEKRGE